jgi:SAM-dependent methyltransferase
VGTSDLADVVHHGKPPSVLFIRGVEGGDAYARGDGSQSKPQGQGGPQTSAPDGARRNWKRIKEAGVEADMIPMRLEAHTLPFAAAFFDAIVSIDAYHYFGTDALSLSHLAQFLAPGGRIGVVSPGVLTEIEDGPPAHLEPYWDPDFSTFHMPAWWQRHWERCGKVDVEIADSVPDGWRLWLRWSQACLQAKAAATPDGLEWAARESEMLRIDNGRTLGFTRLVARKR